ncbi:hypothetical protein BDV12DRAFT_166590 [Aspergillus spectabilis]
MFQRERAFGSIPPACAVIENYWRQRDLGCDENPRKTRSSSFSRTNHNGYARTTQ